MAFLNSIISNSKKFDDPFTHWELNQPLTDLEINDEIIIRSQNQMRHIGKAIEGEMTEK